MKGLFKAIGHENGFILDFDQLQILQTTNLVMGGVIIIDITVYDNIWLAITKDLKKHFSVANIEQKMKFVLQLALTVCDL